MKDIVDGDKIRGGAGDRDDILESLSQKVGELNEFLQSSVDGRWGENVVDIAMDVINEQREEILNLENVIKSMKSEIGYSLKDSKSEDVKEVYLNNAIRYAEDVIYVD